MLVLAAVALFGWFVAGKNLDGTRNWGKTFVWVGIPLIVMVLIYRYVKKKKKAIGARLKRARLAKMRGNFSGISLAKKKAKRNSSSDFARRMALARAKKARERKAAKAA